MFKTFAKILLCLFIITPLLFFAVSKLSNSTLTFAALIVDCNDGEDNDGDGLIDGSDPGCRDTSVPLNDRVEKSKYDCKFSNTSSKTVNPGDNISFKLTNTTTGFDVKGYNVGIFPPGTTYPYQGAYVSKVVIANADGQEFDFTFTMDPLFGTGKFSAIAYPMLGTTPSQIQCSGSPITITVNTVPLPLPELESCLLTMEGSSSVKSGDSRTFKIADEDNPAPPYYLSVKNGGGTETGLVSLWTFGEHSVKFSGPILGNPGTYTFFLKQNGIPVGQCSPYNGIQVKVIKLVSGKNPCEGGVCNTALGSIKTEIGEFARKILAIGVGLAGGIALILMVIGSIRVLTSAGDPKNVAAGREMIIAAVAGLLFLIFSVLILSFIGFNIIRISGFIPNVVIPAVP